MTTTNASGMQVRQGKKLRGEAIFDAKYYEIRYQVERASRLSEVFDDFIFVSVLAMVVIVQLAQAVS